jgi:hypothetical protein
MMKLDEVFKDQMQSFLKTNWYRVVDTARLGHKKNPIN